MNEALPTRNTKSRRTGRYRGTLTVASRRCVLHDGPQCGELTAAFTEAVARALRLDLQGCDIGCLLVSQRLQAVLTLYRWNGGRSGHVNDWMSYAAEMEAQATRTSLTPTAQTCVGGGLQLVIVLPEHNQDGLPSHMVASRPPTDLRTSEVSWKSARESRRPQPY